MRQDDMTGTPDARDIRTRRKLLAILRIIQRAGRPLGGARIARELQNEGIELSQRTVRYYLALADDQGLTVSLGRRGRRLTDQGRQEVVSALAVDKVGYVAARVEGLSYRMSFDLAKKKGKVILNVSTIARSEFERAAQEIIGVYEAGLGMGAYVALQGPGASLGDADVPPDEVAIGTVCSVSLNGALLRQGIATTSLFGGLLEIRDGEPYRFTQIIHYAGSTLDPLEVFIKGHMTTVHEAAKTGHGAIGASFREIPAEALSDAKRIVRELGKVGLGGVLVMGRPGQPLLDVPVSPGRVGLIVSGGLNPLAAVEEIGIATRNAALHSLYDFELLQPYEVLAEAAGRPLRKG